MKFTDPNSRPTAPAPLFENIPDDLRRHDQWVLWRYDWRDDAWAKVPYDPSTLERAKSNNPATWSTFSKAREAYECGGFDGIGFEFSAQDEFCGIDFDNCLGQGKIEDPVVKQWLERFDSYTEKSVSGTGTHVIVKGVLGPGLKRGNVEIYDRGRYFTFTGRTGKRREIHSRQTEIDELKRAFTPEAKPRVDSVKLDLSAQELLEKAFSSQNGSKIRGLYDGHLNGHASHSEADLSLCSLLAFWSGGDTSLLDKWLRSSRLYREKWDKRHAGDGRTYGQVTIAKALSGCSEFYQSDSEKAVLVGPSIRSDPEKQKSPTGFSFTALDDLLSEPEEQKSYVWDKTLPSGGFSIVAAKPKVGKSTLARGLADAVSQGATFLGRPTLQGKVIYLCLEEKRREVAAHFRRMGASGSDIIVHTGPTPKDALTALGMAIDEHSPRLVIIDPLSRFVRVLDFNSYGECTRQLEPLIDMARFSECQAHIMALHHNGKGGDLRESGDALLGSTGFFGAVDTLLTMHKRERARTVESIQRYGEDLQETIVHLDPETGAVDAAGDMKTFLLEERKSAIVEAMGTDPSTEAAIKELVGGTNKGLTSKSVRSLFEEGRLSRAGSGKKGDPYLYQIVGRDAGSNPVFGVTDPQFQAQQKPSNNLGNNSGFVGLPISADPENRILENKAFPDEIYFPPGCDIDEVLEAEAIRAEACGEI